MTPQQEYEQLCETYAFFHRAEKKRVDRMSMAQLSEYCRGRRFGDAIHEEARKMAIAVLREGMPKAA